MKVALLIVRAGIEGVVLYVSYYGFCGFWYVVLNPYTGSSP